MSPWPVVEMTKMTSWCWSRAFCVMANQNTGMRYGYGYSLLLPPQRETTYKIGGVELVNVTLEMEPLAQPTQLFG